MPTNTLELDLTDPEQRSFGDFDLIERIGEGGMGLVYRAWQRSLDREVALKLLAAGPWASTEFIASFKHEAQNAARLQHPNIVAVHAIGEQEGLIYYAMELVRGETLARHLDRRQEMPARDAAVMIQTIAEAVDYAHRLGVLHLDIKPENILLDLMGTPKIADFGMARRLGEALCLENEKVSGTPSYMAPEQTALNQGVLSIATDVWGLGAVLYECITGAPPFLARTPEATLRLVREGTVRRLSRTTLVPRDLEAICMKCLAHAPAQRYPAARALADDLGRFLEGRPVSARPLRSWQRAEHWARREPRLAMALAGVMLAMLVGIVASSMQWVRAERSAASAREVNRFINEDVLAAADPYRADLEHHDVVALLARTEARLDSSFADQPEARAQIGLSIARAYFGRGLWHKAQLRMERSYADAVKSLGKRDPITLDMGDFLAQTSVFDGEFARARALYRVLIPLRVAASGPTAAKTIHLERGEAALLSEEDHFEEAIARYERLRVLARTHAPEQLPEIEWALSDLYTETNRWDEAMTLVRSALERTRARLGENHPQYLWESMSLGDMQMMRAQWDDAEATFTRIHEGLTASVGYSHPKTLSAVHYLGLIQLERGQPARALPLLRSAMEGRMRAHGPDHKWTHYSMNRVAQALIALHRTDEAIPLLEQALASASKVNRRQAYVILILDNLGQAYMQRGDLDTARRYLLEGVDIAQHELPANNVRRGMIERSLAQLLARQGRVEDARTHYAIAERIFTQGWGPRHPWVVGIRLEVAALPVSHSPVPARGAAKRL
ncbi:serine/threonine-protein kinase [Lysobacter fragariae]